MLSVLLGLASASLAAFAVCLAYHRWALRRQRQRAMRREEEARGAAARLDLWNRTQDGG